MQTIRLEAVIGSKSLLSNVDHLCFCGQLLIMKRGREIRNHYKETRVKMLKSLSWFWI